MDLQNNYECTKLFTLVNVLVWSPVHMKQPVIAVGTEDCKLVVTCKMQNRNATDKLNPQCSKLALLKQTMLGYYIVDLAYQLHFYFAFCK